MIMYGLPTCTLCTRAQKDLAAMGRDVTFRDVRADRLSDDEIAVLVAEFGDTIIDRTTQTFRNLNAWMRESEAEDQLRDTPALMARPIVTDGTNWTRGWNDEIGKSWAV